ncbi:MAG: helix-turn-helix domain-containing protein [Clostridia bacterium]|nr:helix-turn-helix domain-containing protein [Clostridia bacterium]
MLYLAENIKKYRILKNLTQEDVAEYLHITPQSVSKWERSETYPDITFLPALANIFETSVDLLMGMDTIRADKTLYGIHKAAHDFMQGGELTAAENVYRDALLIYPSDAEMLLGLAEVLALQGKAEEAAALMEKGLPLSTNEKQKATTRAALCFLYLKCGKKDKAEALAAKLPHARESREVIQPLIQKGMDADELDRQIRIIFLGDNE